MGASQAARATERGTLEIMNIIFTGMLANHNLFA